MWGERSRIGEGKVKSKREKKAWEIEKKNTNRHDWWRERKNEKWKRTDAETKSSFPPTLHYLLIQNVVVAVVLLSTVKTFLGALLLFGKHTVIRKDRENHFHNKKPLYSFLIGSRSLPIRAQTTRSWRDPSRNTNTLTRSLACRFRFLVKIIIKKHTAHSVSLPALLLTTDDVVKCP